MLIENKSQGTTVAESIQAADTTLSRIVGLLGRRSLEAGGGIWIRPSSGIHTVGMRFPIDAIGLDAQMRVVKLWANLHPNRIPAPGIKIRSVVELAAGEIEARSIQMGDVLEIRPN